MIWEQGIKLVVMLTKEYEDERLKCFRYWSPVGETVSHGKLEIRCEEEEEIENICTVRQILVRDPVNDNTRLVEQLQYTSWPDHGDNTNRVRGMRLSGLCVSVDTPDDCHDFLKFVQLVQQRRGVTDEPILVHCRCLVLECCMVVDMSD